MPNKPTVQRRGSSPPESQANSRASVEGGTARDAERTRVEILDAATEEFADKGLSGARIRGAGGEIPTQCIAATAQAEQHEASSALRERAEATARGIQSQRPPLERVFTFGGPWSGGALGDCAMEAGATVTMRSDGTASFRSRVSSTDTNDVFSVFIQFFRAENGEFLFRKPTLVPPFNEEWYFKKMPNSGTWYPFNVEFTYPPELFYAVNYIVMWGNC